MPYFRRTSKSSQGPGKNQPVYGMKYPGLGLTIGSRVNFRGAIFDRAMIPLNDNTPVDEPGLPTLQAVLSKMTLIDNSSNPIPENFIIVYDFTKVYSTQDISFTVVLSSDPFITRDVSLNEGINNHYYTDDELKAGFEALYGTELYRNSLTDKDFNNASNPQNLSAVRLPYIDAEYYTLNTIDSSWNLQYDDGDTSANILSGDISGNKLVGVPDGNGAMIEFPVNPPLGHFITFIPEVPVSRGILGQRVADDNGDGILEFDVKEFS